MRRNELILDALEKVPNGDEYVVCTEAGLAVLNIPVDSNYAIIQPSTDIKVRFGSAATATVGVKCEADTLVYCESKAELDSISVYALGACNLFVSYFK